MIITSFTDFKLGLDEYPKNLKGKKLHIWIYKQLKIRDKISCFEITEDSRMCRAIMFLNNIGKIEFDRDTEYEYPYTQITKKGN